MRMTVVAALLALGGNAIADASVSVRPGDDLAQALEEVCAQRAAGQRAELILEDGVYQFKKTLEVKTDDVTIAAKNPGKAIVVGGWSFSGSDFRPIADANLLKRLPEASRAKCVAIDIPEGVFTNRFVGLARKGNAIPEQTPILTVDGEYQCPSRWPNDPVRFWVSKTNMFLVGAHPKYDRDGKPVKDKAGNQVWYTNSVVRTGTGREMKWDLKNAEAYIHGFPSGCAYAFDSSGLLPAPAGFEGVDIGRGAWPSPNTRFSFFNLVEEIDLPGEWSFDKASRKLVLYPTAALKPAAVCAVGTMGAPFLQIKGDRVRVEGLVFTAKSGDYAIRMDKAEGLVAGCRFSGIHRGVYTNGRGNKILSCDFERIQDCSTTLEGGTAKTMQRADNLVENCSFAEFGCLHNGFYAPAISLKGFGNTARFCEMHGTPDHAVDIVGADHMMEYCRIWEASREYGDSGAVYVHGWTCYGTVLRYNDVGSAPGMANGIYLDDFACGVTLVGNILRNVGYFGIFLGGGRDLTIENNLITGAWGGIRIDNRGLWWPAWANRQGFWKGCNEMFGLTNGSPYAVAHPRFTQWVEKDGFKKMTGPLDNVYRNNLIVDVPGYSTSFFVCLNKDIPADRTTFEGNMCVRTKGLLPGMSDLAGGDPNNAPSNMHTSASSTFRPIGPGIKVLDGTPDNPIDLGFVDLPKATFETADYMWTQQGWVDEDKLRAKREGGLCAAPFEKGDLSLREDARLLKEMPGFKPIPFAKIGLYRDAYRTDPTLHVRPDPEENGKPWWKFW